MERAPSFYPIEVRGVQQKTYVPEGEQQDAPASQIGATLEALATTIHARRDADGSSYTHLLLTDPLDASLKKLMEEASETALAAKDADHAQRLAREAEGPGSGGGRGSARQIDDALNHLRYEAADVVYHLLVVMERFDIGIDELAAELNMRMKEGERPKGAVLLPETELNRGK